jgi:hypothetical protein
VLSPTELFRGLPRRLGTDAVDPSSLLAYSDFLGRPGRRFPGVGAASSLVIVSGSGSHVLR